MAAEAASSDSESSDFWGFTDDDLGERTNGNIINELRYDCESDVSVFEDSSDDSSPETESDDEGEEASLDWKNDFTEIHVDEFSEDTGPKHNLSPDSSPLNFFYLLWNPVYFDIIARETNRYAEQRIQASEKGDVYWQDTTPEEMRSFFAINIMMGIKHLPQIWCYWSEDPKFRCEFISKIMPKNRFLKLNQYLHLSDNSKAYARDSPEFDHLYKVRTLIEMLRARFYNRYYPSQNLAVDEGMIGFKGRLSFKQYMPQKPTKWGIKVWQLCDSANGYCCNFQVYTGKSKEVRQHGLGHYVVMNLAKPFLNKHHHIYFDRFFSSVNLLKDLLANGTYACSTVMLNRKLLPPAIKTSAANLKKGDTVMSQAGNLVVTCWRDKRVVSCLSTNCNARLTESERRHQSNSGSTAVQVIRLPEVVQVYNRYMGGVDRSDQMRSYYPVGRPSNKWWRYILWYLVNLTIVNAFQLFTMSEHTPVLPKHYSHLRFRADLAELLCGGYSCRKRKSAGRPAKCVKRFPVDVPAVNLGAHKLVKVEGRKKICRYCVIKGNRTKRDRPVETSFKCEWCDIPLCKVNCFMHYHNQEE